MFKDSKEGRTHFFGDGCGELEHNKPKKWEEDFVEKGASPRGGGRGIPLKR